jgi:hypothetical protein
MKTATEFALDSFLEQGGFRPNYGEPFALELAFTDCYRGR